MWCRAGRHQAIIASLGGAVLSHTPPRLHTIVGDGGSEAEVEWRGPGAQLRGEQADRGADEPGEADGEGGEGPGSCAGFYIFFFLPSEEDKWSVLILFRHNGMDTRKDPLFISDRQGPS